MLPPTLKPKSINTFLNSLFVQLELPGRPNFFFPEPRVFEMIDFRYPEVAINIKVKPNEKYDVEIIPESPMGESASQLSSGGIGRKWLFTSATAKQLSKIRHELVAMTFTGRPYASDYPLATIARVGDDSDRLSPDIIFWTGKSWAVLEIKTAANDYAVDDRFAEAQNKYTAFLTDRATEMEPIIYCVIVVSGAVMKTNLPLVQPKDANFIIDIFSHFLIGRKVLIQAASMGIDPDIQGQEAVSVQIFNDALKRASDSEKIPDVAEPPFITKGMIEDWKKPVQIESELKLYTYLKRRAVDQMFKDSTESGVNKSLSDFKTKMSEGVRFGSEVRKAPIQLPFCVPRHDIKLFYTDKDFKLPEWTIYPTSPLSELWNLAFRVAATTPERFESDPSLFFKSLNLEEPTEEKDMRKRNTHFRVDLRQMSPQVDTYLATKGIHGKKFSETEYFKQLRLKHKTPFSLEAYTEDIDAFLSIVLPTLMEVGSNSVRVPEVEELLKTAKEFSGYKFTRSTQFVDVFYRTKLARSLTFLSHVMEEVNLSFHQFCARNTFILKRLRAYNAWLLIKPTKPDGIISFSLLNSRTQFEAMGLPFKVPEETGESPYVLFDFMTLNRHKMGHYLQACQKACSLLAMFMDLHKLSSDDVFGGLRKDANVLQCIKHFGSSLLVYLEGKTQTSTNLTNVRYAYMEVLKGSFLPVNGLKILSRLDGRPKSRLLVWAYKRIISAFKRMSEDPPRRTGAKQDEMSQIFSDLKTSELEREDTPIISAEEQVSSDEYTGLISWIDLTPLRSFEIALNLSYYGHLHNKEEGDETQGSKQIVQKLIQEELKMRVANKRYMGLDEPVDYSTLKSHEFSKNFVQLSGQKIRQWLEDRFGGSYASRLKSKLNRMMLNKTADTLATMKASAVVDDDLEKEYKLKAQTNKRDKVASQIMWVLSLAWADPRPFKVIDKLIALLEDRGGVRVNLFKKLQIGGTREIFILDIVSRLCIHFVESIARIIGEDLPMEMLTKGDQKMVKSDSHYNRVAGVSHEKKLLGELTVIDSDDASTWCQMFVMPTFGCLMTQLIEDDLLFAVIRVMNSTTRKKIELPRTLLDEFIAKPNVESFSPEITELKRQFSTEAGHHDVVNYHGRYMHNLSNFMQGIYHYTSSLMHGAALFTLTNFNVKILKEFKADNRIPESAQLVQTTKVSSDDSAVLRTLIYPGEKKKSYYIYLAITSYVKRMCYPLFTAKFSYEKSTPCSFAQVEEFNSIWMLGNTIIMPIIKFVYAAMQTKVAVRMEDRLNMLSDSRRQVVENGGSVFLSSVLQELQADVHYSNLGSYVSELFTHYKRFLIEKPHPLFGFYVMEPELFSGILGFDFAYYNHIKRVDVASRIEATMLKFQDVDVNDLGKPSIRLSLYFGGGAKYEEYLKRLHIPPDWQDRALANPEMLYRQPESIYETQFWIWKKSKTPSTLQSFSFASQNKMHQASAYVLWSRAFALSEKRSLNEQVTRRKQVSLLGFMYNFEITEIMSDRLMSIIFPDASMYDSVNARVSDYEDAQVYSVEYKRPNKLISLSNPQYSAAMSMSLMSVMRKLNFNNPLRYPLHKGVKGTIAELDLAFEYYHSVFPWLQRSLTDTLEQSPFKDQIALSDFIRSLTYKTKHYKILGPVRKGLPFLQTVSSIISNCFVRWGVLKAQVTETQGGLRASNTLATNILLMTTAPIDKAAKMERTREILRSSESMISDSRKPADSLKFMSPTDANLALIQYAVKTKIGPEFSTLINIVQRGTRGYFTTRQRYSNAEGKYFGPGVFEGAFDTESFRLIILNDVLTEINVRNYYKFNRYSGELRSLIKSLKLSAPEGKTISRYWYDFDRGRLIDNKAAKDLRHICPIREDLRVQAPRYEGFNFDLDISENGGIRLTMNIGRASNVTEVGLRRPGESFVTVLRYQPNLWKFDSTLIKSTPKARRLGWYWSNFKSVAVEDAADALKLVVSQEEKYAELKNWMVRTIAARVRFTRSETSSIMTLTEEPTEEEMHLTEMANYEEAFYTPLTEENQKRVNEGIEEQIKEEEMAQKILQEPEREGNIDPLGIEFRSSFDLIAETQMKATRRIVGKATEPIESLHPFWDLVISACAARDDVTQLVLGRYFYNVRGDQLSVLISQLVDNEHRPKRATVELSVMGRIPEEQLLEF